MLIDFDILTVIIGVLIYATVCFFIHKKYHKEKIYYVFSTIMFCYFLSLAKHTLFPIIIAGLPSNIKGSINLIPFHNGINKTDIFNFVGTVFGFFLLYIFSRIFIKADRKKLGLFWAYVYDTCNSVRLT